MTTFNWSTLTNGQSIAFNPNVDVLAIDDTTISAADLAFSFTFNVPFTSTLNFAGKVVTLQTDFRTLTTSNITFADGTLYLVGDNTTSILNDNNANTLTGGNGDDRLIGLGGNDYLVGGAGNDIFNTAYALTPGWANDTVDGGTGSDTLAFSALGNTPITVDLANHLLTSTLGNISLISIETVIGTSGNDSLAGGDIAHGIDSFGNTTSERFRGAGGNDTITGGSGNGFFTIADYAGNSAVQAVSANLSTGQAVDGLGGTDTLANVDALRGGAAADSLLGGSLSRGANGIFFESFRGNAGNDTLNGNNATSGGSDSSGDRADYSNNTAAQPVNVSLGTGIAQDGLGGTDTLIEIDAFYGGAGNDTLAGSSNNDDLDGGAGNDILDGGAGSDTARFQQSTAGVIVNMSEAAITVNAILVAAGTANDGMGGTDTLTNMENVRGSDFNDHIRGSDNISVRQFLAGDAGNDTIDGGAGIDIANYSNGALTLGGLNAFIENGAGSVNDRKGGTDTLINIEGLAGTHTNDTLTGGLGEQWFCGHGGNDTLDGGAGNDWVLYSNDPLGVTINLAAGTVTDGWNGAAGLLALGGTDTLISIENAEASDYDDMITGNAGANELIGRAGADTIFGGDGNDTIQGDRNFTTLTGSDVILSEAGDDVVFGGLGDDVVALGAGFDTAIGEGGNDAINGEGGNDAIDGGDGNDTLLGWDDQDILFGSVGNDILFGGNGDDIMMGNRGDPLNATDGVDLMFGDAGQDTIHGGAGNDGVHAGDGNDVIDGGIGNDNVIGGLGADIMLGSGITPFITAQFPTGSPGNDQFIYYSAAEGGDSIYGFDLRAGNEDKLFLQPMVNAFSGVATHTLAGLQAGGHLQLLDTGADIAVQVDADGGGNNYSTLVTLIGVANTTDLNDAHFLLQI